MCCQSFFCLCVKYSLIFAIVCYKKVNFADTIKLRLIKVVTKLEIQQLIENGQLDVALECVEEQLLVGADEHLFYLKGKILLRKSDWKGATDAFLHAQELNPESPAREQLAMIKDIMDFYNKDMYNH